MTDFAIPDAPRARYRFTAHIELDEGWFTSFSGSGTGHLTPVTGGEVTGALDGEVLPVGADWSRLVGETSRLDARWVIRTSAGQIIQVQTGGYYRTTDEVLARIDAGESVSADEYYFRLTGDFESDDSSLAWLTENQFIGFGEDLGDAIRIHYYVLE